MREFIFTGRLTLNGATFLIRAEDEEEAREKARAGNYDDCEFGGAEMVDWEIRPNTIEEI